MLTEHAWDRKFGEPLPTLDDVMREASQDDDDYVSIGFGRFKEKDSVDDPTAPTFKKDDSGAFIPTKGDDKEKEPKGDKEEPKGKGFSPDDFERDFDDEEGGDAPKGGEEKPSGEPEGSEIKKRFDDIFSDDDKIDKMWDGVETQSDAIKLAEDLGTYAEEVGEEVIDTQKNQIKSIIDNIMTGDAKEGWGNSKAEDILTMLAPQMEQHGVSAVAQSMRDQGAVEPCKEDELRLALVQMETAGQHAGRTVGAIAIAVNALQELHKELPESTIFNSKKHILRETYERIGGK